MRAMIAVVGMDRVGIIAGVSTFLSENSINILNINQTILDGFFTMMMNVDLDTMSITRDVLDEALTKLEEELQVKITIMSEEVLKAMHRI
ncbi:ACT domain-containing protein [Spirochaeta cellobiosiphila]|uniref:ACT domain-containing protein n=1 Tax=Spirochaeta cellobiosiphila TaxID=504483 RepID=UPI000406CFBF|nr:ACT domain-containing protein [Spirochaeta cellobiosiphila]